MVLALASLVLAAPASAKNWTELRIGVSGNYPPFTFVDEHDRFQGFEIDLALALCQRMGVKCEFVKEEWEDMIPSLVAHSIDAIFASMSITEDRKKQIAFSNRYYTTPTSLVARKALNLRDTSPAGMKGRVIGVQRDTLQADYLKEVYVSAGAVARIYTTQAEAQFELARGQIDAIMVDKLSVYDWLAQTQGECCAYAGEDLTDAHYIGEGVGVGLRKEDGDLLQMINRAIDQIIADGTYKKINDKYFPFSVY
ncbi:amino acid ABC transporter [Terrihabitans soli]|uniref:Amino acid ABC transporter n=1 Tax=Terrihabitans soli TaxID=708113 RepID=A0A6S6QTP9_9HYPH|nr:amino acid ABC transporter [Terrihabitans soli]